MYTDGSVRRTVGQLYDAAVNGDGLVFGQRLAEQGVGLAKKWLAGRPGGRGEGDPGTGHGPGPAPPAAGPPAPPPAAAPPAT